MKNLELNDLIGINGGSTSRQCDDCGGGKPSFSDRLEEANRIKFETRNKAQSAIADEIIKAVKSIFH